MEIRECFALLVLIILTSIHPQLKVLADRAPFDEVDGTEAPFDDLDGTEELRPAFWHDIPEDFCTVSEDISNGDMFCGILASNRNKYVCIGRCGVGFEFYNRKKEGKITCDLTTGKWRPNSKFPDCQKEIICDPLCQNGGSCVDENVCSCRDGFTGNLCHQTPFEEVDGTEELGPVFGENIPEGFCEEPEDLSNGEMLCGKLTSNPKEYVCIGRCDVGFEFSNRKKEVKISCNFTTGKWRSNNKFPDCQKEIICDPLCQNGGSCVDENVCSCRDGFTGNLCHQRVCTPPCQNGATCRDNNTCSCAPRNEGNRCEIDICKMPPKPSNGKIRCQTLITDPTKFACMAECEERYRFPGGEKKIKHTCDSTVKEWSPEYEFPNCEAECIPPCQNGGSCENENKCNCTEGFEGDRCENAKNPPPCREKWTEYFNTDNPRFSEIGDDESIDRIKQFHELCTGVSIKDIECKVIVKGKFVDYENVTGLECSKDIGFTCNRKERGECEDFAVRFLCGCNICQTPPKPRNAIMRCAKLANDRNRLTCVAVCEEEYVFPSGETAARHTCDLEAKAWFPKYEFSDCEGPPMTELPPTLNPMSCSTDKQSETDTCEVLGSMLKTFDGHSYRYDACNHVLVKEQMSELFSVTVRKICSPESPGKCYRHLNIKVDGLVITLGPGVDIVTVKNTRVPVRSLSLVSKKFRDIEFEMIGSTLVFRSLKYNFEVTWDKLENSKIKVSECLRNRIAGLCGLYDRNLEGDLKMPNGLVAHSDQEFGDSWAIGSLEKCSQPDYIPEISNKAMSACVKLREKPFQSCFGAAELNRKLQACVSFMVECMQRSVTAGTNSVDESEYEKCKCHAYETFTEDCEIYRMRPSQEWRILHDCAPSCPDGLEWLDCGPGCLLTCDNYRQQTKICTSDCVAGCYCPSGLVYQQNQCVKPKLCQD